MSQKFVEKGISQEVDGEVLDLRKGASLMGIYKGGKEFDGKRQGEVNTIHYFEVDGKLNACWGAKDLNYKLAGEEGKTIRVSFKEKKALRDGRSKNIFLVEIAQ